MKLFKITDKNGRTRGDTQWGENVTHKATARGRELCTNQVIHAYRDPYLAIFHNPIGGNYKYMQIWEAKGKVVADDGMKVGCKSLTTLKQIPVPKLTTEQRIEIAIRCAVEVYKDKKFIGWANKWLDSTDRTQTAAAAAADAARAAHAAAYAAAAAAADAYAAAHAAYDAAYAAIVGSKTLAQCADIVRRYYPEVPK